MNTICATFCILAGLCADTFATLVYDIDYEPPAYTDGQAISGAGIISDSINGFSSQGLLIRDGGGVNFYSPETYMSGVHAVSWDFTIPVDQSSSLIINGQLNSSAGVLFSVTMATGFTGYEIQYGDGFPIKPSVPFVVGQAYSFEVLMNLDADCYSFWLDGNLLEDSVAMLSDANLYAVDFDQNQTPGLQAGLDNFRWEIIPEPSSLGLTLCGIASLLFGRIKKAWGMRKRYEHQC